MPIPLLQILRSIKETKDIGQIQTLLKKNLLYVLPGTKERFPYIRRTTENTLK